MPMIQLRASTPLPTVQAQHLREGFGQAITLIPGKTEQWLMLELAGDCTLAFQGNDREPAAFVEVKYYGNAPADALGRLTAAICTLLETELHIPQSRVFVCYAQAPSWGWNGQNL